MTEYRTEQRRQEIRELCAKKGIGIIPYGVDCWWLSGAGVSLVVRDLASVRECDITSLPMRER